MSSARRHRVPVLARLLRGGLWLTFAIALVGLLPGDAGRVGGWILMGMLIGTPLLRVAYLVVRWARGGDWRFALVGAALLATTAVGTVLGA